MTSRSGRRPRRPPAADRGGAVAASRRAPSARAVLGEQDPGQGHVLVLAQVGQRRPAAEPVVVRPARGGRQVAPRRQHAGPRARGPAARWASSRRRRRGSPPRGARARRRGRPRPPRSRAIATRQPVRVLRQRRLLAELVGTGAGGRLAAARSLRSSADPARPTSMSAVPRRRRAPRARPAPSARSNVRCASPSRPWVSSRSATAIEQPSTSAMCPARAARRSLPRSRGARPRGRRVVQDARPDRADAAARTRWSSSAATCEGARRVGDRAGGVAGVERQRCAVHLDGRRDPGELVAVEDDQLVVGQGELPLDVVQPLARPRRTRCSTSARRPGRSRAPAGAGPRRRAARRPSPRITASRRCRPGPGWRARPGRRPDRRRRRRARAGPRARARRPRRTSRWPAGAARRPGPAARRAGARAGRRRRGGGSGTSAAGRRAGRRTGCGRSSDSSILAAARSPR